MSYGWENHEPARIEMNDLIAKIKVETYAQISETGKFEGNSKI